MKASRIATDFFRGRFPEVIRRTLDAPRWPGRAPRDFAYVIGSLSFLGRVPEAESLYDAHSGKLQVADQIECRFFLGIALARQSRYSDARRYFGENLRELNARLSPRAHFFIYQGISFYRYFSGRLAAAERASRRALDFAIRGGFLYGRVLASDIRGHILIQRGQVSEGLRMLEQAGKLAQLLRNEAAEEAIEISVLCYRAQFGISPVRTGSLIQAKARRLSPKDNYSHSSLLLELVRQLLLRGDWSAAAERLNHVSQIIYATQNRRHEVILNLRHAELYYLSGQFQQALNFVRASQKCLDPEVDLALELQILGMERKLLQALGWKERERGVAERIRKLSRIHGGEVNRRIVGRYDSPLGSQVAPRKGDDPLGDLLDRISSADIASVEASIEAILDSGYFGLLPGCLKVAPGSAMIYFELLPGSITVFDRGAVQHFATGMTQSMRAIARRLAAGPASKKALIRDVWGYQYHPLRHDPVVYSAITAFRKVLGKYGAWIETLEDGYRLALGIDVRFPREEEPSAVLSPESIRVEAPAHALNLRQIKILRYLKVNEAIDVGICRRLFKVSEITASRDLSALNTAGLVIRVGKARATKYIDPRVDPKEHRIL